MASAAWQKDMKVAKVVLSWKQEVEMFWPNLTGSNSEVSKAPFPF